MDPKEIARKPIPSQSIPLRDLSQPSAPAASYGQSSRPPAEGMGRARQAFGERRRLNSRSPSGLRPANQEWTNNDRIDGHLAAPPHAHQVPYDEGELSPLNMGDFQAASVGLSLAPTPPDIPPGPSSRQPSQHYQDETPSFSAYATPSYATPSRQPDQYFASNDDHSPLTDARYIQPISGSQLPPAPGQPHDRPRRASRYGARMLGDDLEGGAHARRLSLHAGRSRGLSDAAQPLFGAGDALRKMSQRVVNLSNEPEILESTIHRQNSQKGATMDAPPSFPAMMEYAHDEPAEASGQAPEKDPALDKMRRQRFLHDPNPLKGRSLGIFSPGSRVRRWLCEVLVHPWTEPMILVLIVLQTIVLAIDATPYIQLGDPRPGWTQTIWGWILVGLFSIYTLEIVSKIIVSGFIKNAYEYSTLPHGVTVWQTIRRRLNFLLGTPRSGGRKAVGVEQGEFQPSIVRSFTALQEQNETHGSSRQAQRARLARRAFMRHSFNRVDMIAVVSFWVAFLLSLTGIGSKRHIYVFQMLACLRILRLLSLTTGTSVILRSLKKAAPLLVNVAFLIGFFWLLFAIVGVQSFKASLGRNCVYLGIDDATTAVEAGTDFAQAAGVVNGGFVREDAFGGNIQFCGGSLTPNGTTSIPYFFRNGSLNLGPSKGFLCPQGSICLQRDNPYNNSISFDNIGASLELVFVIMSSNTFSDILYYTTDSDSLAGSLFFIFGIVIMSFWLINLLVAVITSSFQVIREESRASAFGADEQLVQMEKEEEEEELPKMKRKSWLKRVYDKTFLFWIIAIVFDLVVQALRTSTSPDSLKNFINGTELIVTALLLVEIIVRFAADWRGFHRSKSNWFDLLLAIATTVILIPPIHSSDAFPALTMFQILRVYRVVYAIPFVRELVIVVLGNVSGILNLIIFVFLLTFLAAIFAVQLLRGEVPQNDSYGNFVRVPFTNIFNSFLGMYQILSSENWTNVMYSATAFEEEWHTSWISATFFILWYIFANFIILNMFIAVIQENFDVSEDEKRLHQVRAFLQQRELTGSTHSNLSLAAIFQIGRSKNRRKDPIDFGPATIDMFKDTVVRDFLDEQMEAMHETVTAHDALGNEQPKSEQILLNGWNKLKQLLGGREQNPFYSDLMFSRPYEELDPRTMAGEIATAAEQRRTAQREYLVDHPRYNVSLFIFQPDSHIRRFCQSLVGPGRGSKRFQGIDPIKVRWYTFSIFIYACIIAMVALACIATPLYQLEALQNPSFVAQKWFIITDGIFAGIFLVEAIIKVIADGLFFAPNAYLRGAWGMIDAVVLVTLWISVIASIEHSSDVARVIGAFKALRALRLLNVSDSARNTFHSIIVRGAWKLISAAFVSLSLLIPFAIYGVNLFNGRLEQCNDSNVQLLSQCTGEYAASPFSWNFLAPRQVSNPYFNFDDFGESMFILFQIVSQEGWIDVMWAAIAAQHTGQQPVENFNPANGLFFVVFNLLGTVFILTLFVSIFMRSYTEQTGVAFLTAEQRSWLELRKLLRQISPSKRPGNQTRSKFGNWCYRRAVSKQGKWQRMITLVLILHVILLAAEFTPDLSAWEEVRNGIFMLFLVIYLANIVIRIIGLTWERFRRSSWDLFSVIIVPGTVLLTILTLFEHNATVRQLQRLFLAFIALLLIPRNNQLDQLFKTAAASFSAIANLLVTWFVLFLVFAIAMTQTLGLTRFGSMGSSNLNFRTITKALVLLFRTSVGEGWNQIMSDFANAIPPNCVSGNTFFQSDCGSKNWARFLFISWNIISMYIFTSMFVSLIFESFSYVYQRSSGLAVLNREEIRRFKQAWATFDPDGTGFITKEQFPKLLGELSGIFSMRIYEGDHTVQSILDDCRVDPRGMEPQRGIVEGIDLYRLNQRLRTIDVQEVRRRRQRLMIFSQEILVSADPDRGVSFQSCLLILAHYNVINDSKALRLEEFLRRRYRLQRVEEEVQRRIVIGFFDTLFWSRQFRRRRELRDSARMVDIPQFEVPEILVDHEESNWGNQTGTSKRLPPRPTNLPQAPPTPTINVNDQPAPSSSMPVRHSRGYSRGWNRAPSPSVSPIQTEFPAQSFPAPPGYPAQGYQAPSVAAPGLSARMDGPMDLDSNPFAVGEPSPEFPSPPTRNTNARGIPLPEIRTDFSQSSVVPEIRTTEVEFYPSHTPQRSPALLSPNVPPPQGSRHRRQQSSINSRSSRGNLSPLESFDNSAWGESIRRSFTTTRRGTRGHRPNSVHRPPSGQYSQNSGQYSQNSGQYSQNYGQHSQNYGQYSQNYSPPSPE